MKKLITIIIAFLSVTCWSQTHQEMFLNNRQQNHSLLVIKGYSYLGSAPNGNETNVMYRAKDKEKYLSFGLSYNQSDQVESIYIISNKNDIYNIYFDFCAENGVKGENPDFDYLFEYNQKYFYFKIKIENEGPVYVVWITK